MPSSFVFGMSSWSTAPRTPEISLACARSSDTTRPLATGERRIAA
jgi:hypothetical protein